MNKKTKLILSLVGVAAIVVPAILLVVATSKTVEVPSVPSEDRQIDETNISDSVSRFKPSQSPISSSASASPLTAPYKSKESTSSSE
ncbi:MAG: hypothetical protein Q8P25_00440 [Candidatus Curtissbacteria bacterium]|nr:hypothetical protein [Candidatus Curtissbacteria bacterium]